MKRTFLFFLIIFWSAVICFPAYTLKGLVVTGPEEKPVPFVAVSIAPKVKGQDKAGPTGTGTDGKFKMVFKDKKAGETVYIQLKKDHFVAIEPWLKLENPRDKDKNKEEDKETVEIKLPYNQEKLIKIYMCKKDEKVKSIAYLNTFLGKEINERDEKIRQLSENLKWETKNKQEGLNEINRLRKEKKILLEQKTIFPEKFARLSLTGSSEMVEEAITFIEKGDIKRADEVLDEEKAFEEMRKCNELDRELNEKEREVKEGKRKVKEGKRIHITVVKLKMIVKRVRFEFDEAENLYQRFIDLNPEDVDTISEYVRFLASQNKFHKAIKISITALTALEKTNRDSDKALILSQLGNLYDEIDEGVKAKESLEKALRIRKGLVVKHGTIYKPFVAHTYNDLAVVYSHLTPRQYKAEKKYYKEALETYEDFAKNDPLAYKPDVAIALNNRGIFYKDRKKYNIALESFERALKTLEDYNKLEQSLKKEESSKKEELKQSLKVEGLSKKEALQSLKEEELSKTKASIHNNMGVSYEALKKYKEAEDSYKKALKIYEGLVESNPQAYLPRLAVTHNNLATLYSNDKRYNESEASLKEALETYKTYEKIADDNRAYLPFVAETHNHLARLYLNLKDNRYKDAETFFISAKDAYKKLVENYPGEFDGKLCRSLLDLAVFYVFLLEREPRLSYHDKGVSYLNQAMGLLKKDSEIPKAEAKRYKREGCDLNRDFKKKFNKLTGKKK